MEQPYSFHCLDKAIFTSFSSPDFQEKLRKWGFLPHMNLWKFRFDLPYNEFSPASFIRDLVNSPEVQSSITVFRGGRQVDHLTEINFCELRCGETSMDYFKFLQENDFVNHTGYIKKIIPDYFEEIEICDKIREALLVQESEEYELLDETRRSEFLFRIFQHIAVGGGMCQYEDEITDYLEVVKGLYKDLVSVTKDSESGELKVLSKVFQLLPGEQFSVFPNPHVQDFCYIIVDPSFRQVNVWYHKWTGMWGA